MKFGKSVLVASTVLFVLASSVAFAAEWRKLASRDVTDKVDHDTVDFGPRQGVVNQLKFKVRKNGVHFMKVVVHYRNGGDEKIEMKDNVPAGGESRAINLNGGTRKIKQIEFWYEANSVGKGGASIDVFGK